MMQDPSITQFLIAAGVAAVGLMQGMILTRQNRHGDNLAKIGESVSKLQGWAFGPTNTNGANGDIRKLQSDVAEMRETRYGRRASDIN